MLEVKKPTKKAARKAAARDAFLAVKKKKLSDFR